jgi:hypothetical protein
MTNPIVRQLGLLQKAHDLSCVLGHDPERERRSRRHCEPLTKSPQSAGRN